MAGIFISYRREDSSGHAGRLYDAVSGRFGKQRVFMDVTDMEPGMDFAERIRTAVGNCEILLAIVGRDWSDARDDRGDRRLDDERDFVRLEIEAALVRPDVTVVPVLVREARLPRGDDLPPSLAGLSRRHAVRLDDDDWHDDVSHLLDALERHLRRSTPTRQHDVISDDSQQEDAKPWTGSRPVPWRPRPEWSALAAVLAAAVASVPAFFLVAQPLLLLLPRDELWEAVVRLATFRATFWAIVAAAVAGCVALVARRSPIGRALRGLIIGAAVGLVAGALTALLRDAGRPEAAIFASLLVLGTGLGGYRVLSPSSGLGALGGMTGGAIAALLLTQDVVTTLYATQLLPAVLIVACAWAPELARSWTASPDPAPPEAERPAAVGVSRR